MDKKIQITFLVLIIFITLTSIIQAEEIVAGRIYKKITCLDKPEQSYSLFLPQNYSQEKKWPVVYAFDAGGRGYIPVERFQDVADHYGYIVAGSNNARNGPTSIFTEALKAVWADTHKRFSIDDSRIYSAGFSGGARMAVLVHHVVGKPVAGIIACGAGLPGGLKPEHLLPAAYYGIIGLCDMNYKEMLRLEKLLKNSKVEYSILIINSTHQWPDEKSLARAVEWMEISAMKRGFKKRDPLMIESLFLKYQKYANELEGKGFFYLATRAHESAQRSFETLLNINDVKDKLLTVRDSHVYKKIVKEEEERYQKGLKFIKRFNWVLNNAEKQSPDFPRSDKVLKDLQVHLLQKIKENEQNPHDACWAERLLVELKYMVMRKGQFYYNERDFVRAIFFTRLITLIFKDNSNSYYYLACLYSLTGKKKEALLNLKKAVEMGFANLEMLKKDDDLNSIREEKTFREILKKMKR